MLPVLGLLTLALAAAPVAKTPVPEGSVPEGPKSLQLARAIATRGKLLLCHPKVLGKVSWQRVDAFLVASRKYTNRLFDYGNVCEGAAEAAHAAADLHLRYGIMTTAAAEPTGSRYVLHLAEAKTERIISKKELLIPPGVDAVKPLEQALGEMVDATAEGRSVRWGAVATMGLGVAGVAVGAGFGLAARSASNDGAKATTPAGVLHAKRRFDSSNKVSTGCLAVGGAAVLGGFLWQFAF
jgi:hypothetical protein